MIKIHNRDVSPRLCSISEFNNQINHVKDRCILNRAPMPDEPIYCSVFLWTEISKAYLVYQEYKPQPHNVCFETDLNGLYADGYLKYIQPVAVHLSAFASAFKFPKVVKSKEEAKVHAAGILWSNHKFKQQKTFAYEYDLHLAWLSTFMTCKLPDTSVEPRLNNFVKEGEIGFLIGGNDAWACGDSVVFDGSYADYIFPAIDNPNPTYTDNLLKRINKLEGLERTNLKNRFNYGLGNCQNYNPWIRVAVIAQSNQKIIDLILKYKNKIVFSVTDSLGTTERIPELDQNIGDQPGQWSIKSQGYIYTVKTNRLYLDENNNIINATFRGVPKEYLIDRTLSDLQNFINFHQKLEGKQNIYVLKENTIKENF